MEYQSGAVRPIGSIEQGWQLIKNDYFMFVLMMLIFGVVVFVLSMILGFINNAITSVISGALGMATAGGSQEAQMSAAILPAVIQQVVGFFTSIIVTTVSGVLIVGIYKSLSGIANSGKRAEIGDLFSGFEHIQACFIYAVVASVIQFIIAIAAVAIGATIGIGALGLGMSSIVTSDGQLNPAIFGGMLIVFLALMGLYIVISLNIAALTAFVYPLIAERNLSGGQALMVSIRSGLANLGGLLLLMILMFFMILGGILACFIGVLFVAPILTAALYSAFQNVFGRIGGGPSQYNAPPPPPNFGQQPPPNFGQQPPRY